MVSVAVCSVVVTKVKVSEQSSYDLVCTIH